MQKFDPQLVQVMRNALEEVMTKVPLEYSNSPTKAYLAECILKAAAQGQTSYDQLVAAAADQIDQIQVVLSPFPVGSGKLPERTIVRKLLKGGVVHAAIRHVSHPRPSQDRRHVMPAMACEGDAARHDHLVLASISSKDF
jgi:hypothetical protein